MKGNLIKVILVMSMASFIVITSKINVYASSNSDNILETNKSSEINLQEGQYNNSDKSEFNLNEKIMSVNKISNQNEAEKILMNADNTYINYILNSKENASLNYERKIDSMNLTSFYDIPNEPCYVFSLKYDINNVYTGYDSIYYVGINSGKVYILNGMTYNTYAYEISADKKVNSFVRKNFENSINWH